MRRRPLAPSTIMVLGVVRALPLALLGGFYVWMAGFIDGNGGRGVDWIGAAIVAILFGLAAILAITRAFRRARAAAQPPAPPPVPPAPQEPAFDAGAAIEHYLARKAQAGPPERPGA